MKVKPPYVYVGGKRRMLSLIAENIPKNFGNYFEPFLGGGAVALYIMENFPNRHYHLSDFNDEIPLVWLSVRDDPEELSERLEEHASRHSKSYFEGIRNWDRNGILELQTDVERAARFIYICGSSFGGGYTVDNNGFCDKGWADARPFTPDTENIIELNQLLNDRAIHIYKRDFKEVGEQIRAGDLIYLDPPYDVDADREGYTGNDGYVKNSPTDKVIKEVKALMNSAGHHGAYALASNSSTAKTEKLWDGWNSVEKEIVWSSGSGREPSIEKLWGNYALWRALEGERRETRNAAAAPVSDEPDEDDAQPPVDRSEASESHTEAPESNGSKRKISRGMNI